MNKIAVFFFATLRDRVGAKCLEFELPEDTTVKQLKAILVKKHPVLAETMDFVIVAINREYAIDEKVIPKDAEVAIFPPVSGG